MRPLHIASAALVIACGSAAHPGSTVPPPARALGDVSIQALLPPDTDGLLFTDLAAMRRTAFYPAIAESLDAWGPSLERIGAAGQEPAPGPTTSDVIGRTEWALFAQAGADPLVFVAGRFDDDHARVLLDLRLGAASEMSGMLEGTNIFADVTQAIEAPPEEPSEPVLGTIGDRRAWTIGDDCAVEISPGLWLVGSRRRADEVLARAVSPRIDARPGRIDVFQHQVAGSFSSLDGMREALAGDMPWMRSIRSASFTMDLSDGVRAELLLETTGAHSAAELERDVRASLAGLRADDAVRLLGLGSLVDDVEVRANGDDVVLALDLDAREANLHWGRVSGAVGAALFVLESFSGLSSGLADAAQAEEDDAFMIHEIDVRITSASRRAPARRGRTCLVEIGHYPGAAECAARVTCGERVLYGEDSSILECHVGADGIIGLDDRRSDEDGDAAVTLDTRDGVFELDDGGYSLSGRVQGVRVANSL